MASPIRWLPWSRPVSARRLPVGSSLRLESLEDRLAPATFAGVGGQLALSLTANGESVNVVSGGGTYTLTLTGGTWSGTDGVNVTGNGTAALAVTANAFSLVIITDSAQNNAATFADSGANAYSDPFAVTFDAATAGEISFTGTSRFGSNNLSASTSRNVVVSGGAGVSTTGGGITLSAGNDITVDAALATGGAGSLLLTADADGDGTGDFTSTAEGTLAALPGGISIQAANVSIQAGINTDGAVVITAEGNLAVTAAVFGSSRVQVNAGTSGAGTFSSTSGGTVGAAVGPVYISAPAVTIGAAIYSTYSGVVLVSDSLAVGATVTANDPSQVMAGLAGVVTIAPRTAGRGIDLGTESVGSLSLTDAELDRITTRALRIGSAGGGSISVSAAISPLNTTQLELTTGGAITDAGAGILSETRLALTAATGVGTGPSPLDLIATNLEATSTAGGLFLSATGGPLTVGGVTALSGLSTGAGNIALFSDGGVTVAEAVSSAGGGDVALVATFGDIVVSAGVGASGGNGGVFIAAAHNLTLDAAVSTVQLGGVTLNAGAFGGTGDFTSSAAGTVSAGTGTVSAGGTNVTVGGVIATAGGFVALTADDIDLVATVTATIGGGVYLLTRDAGTTITLGADLGFGLTDADLDLITASVLHIGTQATSAAGITVTAAISPAHVTVLSLETAGAITGTPPVIATALALRAGVGIALDTSVAQLAFVNSSGAVSLTNAGALTVTSVDGLTASANTGTTTAVTAGGPLTIAFNVTSAGSATFAAADAGTGDVLAISAGATVRVTAGDLTLAGGDGITLAAAATAQASGSVLLNVGTDGTDADGSASTLLGRLVATSAGVRGGAGNDSITVDLVTTPDLVINSGAGSDAFDISPNADGAITVIGGTPASPATPGDVLVVELGGTLAAALTSTGDASGLSGTWTFGNRRSVTFSQIEAISPGPTTVTSGATAVFSEGAPGSFTVTTAGSPPGGLTAAGTLPVGVTFTDNGDGTGTLAGTPAVGGAFALTFTASNGFGIDGTQSFTLTVNTAPLPSPSPPVVPPVIPTPPFTPPLPIPPVAPPSPVFVVATPNVASAGTAIKVFDPATGQITRELVPFAGFAGPVETASADLDGDGVAEVIVGAGFGGGPRVVVLSGATGEPVASFYAFGNGFTGGIDVAAGDVTGDGVADLIVAAGPGGGPHVKVFDGRTFAEVRSFFAYDPGFLGGVNVAAGDVTGDGKADIVTGTGAGGAPHVKAFGGADLAVLYSFFAYAPTFVGGARVAVGDMNGDGFADIVTGAGTGAGPHVKVIDGRDGFERSSFFAFAAGFSGGVSVSTTDADRDGKADIVVGAGPGGGPHVKVFDGEALAPLYSGFAGDAGLLGGVNVG